MFSNLLYKSIMVGEKAFHILCEMQINVDDLEKFGVEVIKLASEIKQKIKEAEEVAKKDEAQKPVEDNAVNAEVKPAE